MREPLTPEILKKLPFTTTMHLNGGSEYSTMMKRNDEYNLNYHHHTNGSPEYKYTECKITYGENLEIDLMAEDKEEQIKNFCDEYNKVSSK